MCWICVGFFLVVVFGCVLFFCIWSVGDVFNVDLVEFFELLMVLVDCVVMYFSEVFWICMIVMCLGDF